MVSVIRYMVHFYPPSRNMKQVQIKRSGVTRRVVGAQQLAQTSVVQKQLRFKFKIRSRRQFLFKLKLLKVRIRIYLSVISYQRFSPNRNFSVNLPAPYSVGNIFKQVDDAFKKRKTEVIQLCNEVEELKRELAYVEKQTAEQAICTAGNCASTTITKDSILKLKDDYFRLDSETIEELNHDFQLFLKCSNTGTDIAMEGLFHNIQNGNTTVYCLLYHLYIFSCVHHCAA